MPDINITIHIPELTALSDAIRALADKKPTAPRPTTPAQTARTTATVSAPAQAAPVAAPTASTSTTQTFSTAPAAASSAPTQPAPAAAAPTAAPSYTLDDVARAACTMADAGKDIPALLTQFGVQKLRQLAPDKLGAFALALRQMGARI